MKKKESEELKHEFVLVFKQLLETKHLKEIYEERISLLEKRQATSYFDNLEDIDYLNPEVAETVLTDFAFSILDLVIKEII